MFRIWAGVDIGKEQHHHVVLDVQGEQLLSRQVGNDESELLELLREVLAAGATTEGCGRGCRRRRWPSRIPGGFGRPGARCQWTGNETTEPGHRDRGCCRRPGTRWSPPGHGPPADAAASHAAGGPSRRRPAGSCGRPRLPPRSAAYWRGAGARPRSRRG
ncbi:IS110 family transposase [Streptomyces acidicola]|uniref:IS110 family transposase n=1 Tax=Streptomyces acidicola TaxID=2596892 RepID=UPI0037F22337